VLSPELPAGLYRLDMPESGLSAWVVLQP
jgi:hypothetical protein